VDAAFTGVHFTLLAVCALAALAVFAVMLHSIATFRKARATAPAGFLRSALAETLWAIVPVAILFGAAAPAVKTVMETRRAEVAALAMNKPRVADARAHQADAPVLAVTENTEVDKP
jgi:heme/copper-type cytochrome/quinol oxidase subunit 2